MKFPVLVTRAFKDSTDTVRCIDQAELDSVIRDIEKGDHVFEYSVFSFETRKVRVTSFEEVVP